MRNKFYILGITILLLNCNTLQKTSSESEISTFYSEGIHPFTISESNNLGSANYGVAKLYKGNSAFSNGIFISSDGLLLTNYSSILEYMSAFSEVENSAFKQGFLASSQGEEVHLEGVSLMIEIEQTDVTEEIKKNITDLSPNSEIFQSIQRQKNELISKRVGNRTDISVDIKDSFSGNKHIMTVYSIIKDVRLVFAPSINIDDNNATSSEAVFNEITGEYAVLRAYKSQNENFADYSPNNAPFKPTHFFPISSKTPEETSRLTALGFPNTTYRLETARAINFYYQQLNPTVLTSFGIYLQKEDSLSNLNSTYAIKSIPTRFNVFQNIEFFKTAQHLISAYDVMGEKNAQEENLLQWIEGDTTLPGSYSNIFSYINQAYDIAEQTSDIYFTSSYFNNFSLLDNLAGIYRDYNSALETVDSQRGIDSLRSITLQTHQKFLSQLNPDAELFMLSRFLSNFASVQEKQLPLILFDLFNENAGEDLQNFSMKFVNQIGPSSFLFDIEKANEAISSNRLFDDPLFALLDEILFTQESSQQSYVLYYVYIYPAQQILTRARLQKDPSLIAKPDANSSFAYNVGSFNRNKSSAESEFFYTTNDFSGKASGNAILDSDGNLVGLISDHIDESILGNYIYKEETSFVKALRLTSILEELSATPGTESLLKEIGK